MQKKCTRSVHTLRANLNKSAKKFEKKKNKTMQFYLIKIKESEKFI